MSINRLQLDGNQIEKIEKILLEQGATDRSFVSNNVDQCYYTYRIKDIVIDVLVEDDIFEEKTIIACADSTIIDTIKKKLEGN